MTAPALSVVLATRNRPELLAGTLHGFSEIAPRGVSWEFLVVDDGDDIDARPVLSSFDDRLPLLHLRTPGGAGKNAALNLACDEVSGGLVAFVDDDIVPEPDWFDALLEGAARWRDHEVFGGRTSPVLPESVPPHVDLDFSLVRWALAVSDELDEGPTIPERIWGATMAVRRPVLDAHRFDEKRGPGAAEAITGGDVEFVRRVTADRGTPPVHLSRWRVGHVIRPEQLTPDWLVGRVFRMGRERALRSGRTGRWCVGGVPLHLYRDAISNELLSRIRGARGLRNRLWAAWAWGAIHQYRSME